MTNTTSLCHHHQHCDELFAAAEGAVVGGDWATARQFLERFHNEVERHFRCEEDILFPALESATGMDEGPTQVMRMEHTQARDLMQQMKEALDAQDSDSFSGAADILLTLVQQHNMKEENILYPMCDQQLPAAIGKQVSAALSDTA